MRDCVFFSFWCSFLSFQVECESRARGGGYGGGEVCYVLSLYLFQSYLDSSLSLSLEI
jgi:hypothetical protein